jgi:hypothetical protein
VRIKALNHALDRTLDQFLTILRLHVILLNLAQHLREEFEVLVGFSCSRFNDDGISVEKENASDEKTEDDGLEERFLVVSRHRKTPNVQQKVSIMILQRIIPGQ